jgi:hypothetical protein
MGRSLIKGAGNFNLEEYWDSCSINTQLDAGTRTATIIIPTNSFVERVIAQVVKVPTTTGTCKFKAGDASTSDGFILEQSMEASKAGDAYGNWTDEIGDYLLRYETQSDEMKTSMDFQFIGKQYLSGGTIILTLTTSAACSVPGILRLWVKILRLETKED